MKMMKNVLESHQWNRQTGLRVVLALGSLVSMILASGAGSYWH